MMNQENIFNLDFNMNNKPIIVEDNSQLILEKELERARLEGFSTGYSQGFEEGVVQGKLKAITRNEQEIENFFTKIHKNIEKILKQELIYDNSIKDRVLEISTVIIKKVLPHYTNKYGLDEMECAIRYILSTLIDHQDIAICISSVTFDRVHEHIADIQNSFSNKLTFHKDDSLKELECRVDWKGGGARWSQPDLLDNIQGLFKHFVQSVDLDKEVNI